MQRISIKNFMALEDVDIEINDLLILIGEQASGKSTVSKLIYFFKSLRQDLMDVIFNDLEDTIELRKQLWNEIKRKFYNYFGSTRHLEPFEITYSYDNDKKITLSLYDDNRSLKIDLQQEFFQTMFSNTVLKLAGDVKQLSSQDNAFARNALQRALNTLEDYTQSVFNEPHSPLFLPAGRNISVNYPGQFRDEFYGNLRSDIARQELHQELRQEQEDIIPSSDLYLMTSFLKQIGRRKQRFQSNNFQELIDEKRILGGQVNEQTLSLVIRYIEKILRGKYRHDQQGEKIYYDADNYVYLNNASSGQQEAIRILQDAFLIILDNESAFRVIEEPEAHLYPKAQKYLMEVLAIVLNSTDSQIILTTHSPYILSIVNNLLFATRVANKNPLAKDEIESVIPSSSWLDPQKISVYFLRNGGSESIFDLSTGLIDQNMLDEISEELGADFQELYQIHAKAFA